MSRRSKHRKGSHSPKHHSKGPKQHKSPKPKDRHPHAGRHGRHREQGSGSEGREVVGVVQASDKGFGFLIPQDGSPDAFLPPHQMRTILNGDTIRAKISPDTRKPGKFIGAYLSHVKRANPTLVGLLVKEQGHWSLKPDDSRIPFPVQLKGGPGKGQAGQKAVVRLLKGPGSGPMEGEMEEILGFPDDPGVDLKVVIRKHRWPERFGQAVESQAGSLPPDPGPSDWQGREDLRKIPVLTIDGADAKDFDDALSLERSREGGWTLGVHIADVSHYVREGSPLDQEARERATSLYLPDRVLPMLPHTLSDGLCSLREGVPRLTLSAFLTYGRDGRFQKSRFAKTVIQSGRRGVYEEVQAILDGKAPSELQDKYARFTGILRDMWELSRSIRKAREDAGSLDFDFPEVRAVLDANGRVVDVRKKPRLESHQLIEDFMVAANEAVATHLSRNKVPAVYRIHEPPAPTDLEDLVNFLRAYQIPFKGLDLATPKGLQTLLRQMKGTSFAAVVPNLALRSLKLAVYATRNAGHFGLGLDSYCHFTSPIRRYPDLLVHRALKRFLEGGSKAQPGSLDSQALHCSLQERSAEKAEREGQKVLQLRFMEDKVGETFEGMVRHLTPHGLFLELDPYGVEGFLSLEELKDDVYTFDEKALLIRGHKGRRIGLGNRMKAKVVAVDMAVQRLLLTRVQ